MQTAYENLSVLQRDNLKVSGFQECACCIAMKPFIILPTFGRSLSDHVIVFPHLEC